MAVGTYTVYLTRQRFLSWRIDVSYRRKSSLVKQEAVRATSQHRTLRSSN